MAKFTGTECIICKETFKDGDDIVVCPQCGTPYHRECYTQEGSCINIKLHNGNKSWSQERKDSGQSTEKTCPQCGAENKPHALICESCGTPLVSNMNFSQDRQESQEAGFGVNNGTDTFTFSPDDKYFGLNPDEMLDGDVKISEATDFIGTNTLYYLMIFKRMKATGKKISFSFISFLLPHFFFAHRKMWFEAFITTILTEILSIPQMIYFMITMKNSDSFSDIKTDFLTTINIESTAFQTIYSLSNYLLLIVSVLAFLFANFFYYKHMQRKISKIKSQYTSPQEVSEKITSSGGTSIFGIILVFVVQTLMSFISVYGLMLIK